MSGFQLVTRSSVDGKFRPGRDTDERESASRITGTPSA
jgi:hypothetical protein